MTIILTRGNDKAEVTANDQLMQEDAFYRGVVERYILYLTDALFSQQKEA